MEGSHCPRLPCLDKGGDENIVAKEVNDLEKETKHGLQVTTGQDPSLCYRSEMLYLLTL